MLNWVNIEYDISSFLIKPNCKLQKSTGLKSNSIIKNDVSDREQTFLNFLEVVSLLLYDSQTWGQLLGKKIDNNFIQFKKIMITD